MTILQVSTTNQGGGAASVPHDLFVEYRVRGHRSILAVGYLRGIESDPDVVEIPNLECGGTWAKALYTLPTFLQHKGLRGESRLRSLLQPIAEPRKARARLAGLEEFDYPGTAKLLTTIAPDADIVHCHNLHGGYFDLRRLPSLGAKVPLVMTMHDMWLLTGHCAYSIDCERWEFGCGDCPDLDLYPAVKRDATRENWQRKIEILNRSKPHIVAPSHWVIRRAETVLTKAASYHVIPNGVNLNYFRPGDKLAARIALGLPRDGKIVLFVGSHAKRSRYKDYATIEKAFSEIAEKAATERITFVTVGDGSEAARRVGDCIMKQYPFVHSAEDMARFYQAADVFVHAANAETFGMVIVEAMATGLPVVATAVGGIPELVEHGKTGFLTQKGDATEMAARVLQLIRDETLPLAFSEASVRRAGKHYDLATSVTAHLSLYEEILNGPHATM